MPGSQPPPGSPATQPPSSPPAKPAPPPGATNPDEAKYWPQLQALASMGFTDVRKNLEALKAANGDVAQAVGRLV
jgi:hypothetical protein